MTEETAEPTTEDISSTPPAAPEWHIMTPAELIKVVVSGAVVGLVTMAVYYMLEKYIIEQLFCQSGSACASHTAISSAIAMIIVAIGMLFYLIRERVFRPLLVVLVVTILFWDLPAQLATFDWWLAALMGAILFGVGYGLSAWLVQLRNLLLSVGLVVLLIIFGRLLISL